MAFVRKVRTASGAVAVQVVEKRHGRMEVLHHLGSAHTDADLAVLIERAHAIADEDQPQLDLGLDIPIRAAKMDEVADYRAGHLPRTNAKSAAATTPAPAGSGASRTLRTSAGLLYRVIAGAYSRLGFDELDQPVFKDLVIARIVEPTSKAGALRVLDDLGAQPRAYRTIQRHLAGLADHHVRDQVAYRCFDYAAQTGGLSLVLYDVTTLYFEAEKEDKLRKVGYSKERRVDPQIVVGLLVDRNGFPLEVGCFEGNHAETRTIIPIVKQFLARHGIEGTELVIAADAGMLSAANLTALDEAGLKFIVGSKMTKAPKDLESHFRWHGNHFTNGQIIDTVTPVHGNTQVNNPLKRAEPVWDPQDASSWRAVWQYSRDRARRDTTTLDKQVDKAEAVVEGRKAARGVRFVTTKGSSRQIDEALIQRARDLIGLKGYVTNLPANIMSGAEVISHYHALWRVEESFRMSKTDLQARPIYHRKRDSIEAHLTIVFAALAVSRYLQNRTGRTTVELVKLLRPLRTATIDIGGQIHNFPPAIPADIVEIIDGLEIEPGD